MYVFNLIILFTVWNTYTILVLFIEKMMCSFFSQQIFSEFTAVNQGNRTFKIWKSENRQISFQFMKVWMYEFEERRQGESEGSKSRILQLAGKVDLRSKANNSGVCCPILLKFWNSERNGKSLWSWKYEGDRSKLRFKNGSFSVNRRWYWAEIQYIRWQPLLEQAEFFSRSIFISDCWVSRKSVFWLFLRQKIKKVPIFWARSNRTSESYFVLKFQKHRTIFGSMGFFKVLFMGTDRFYVCMYLCMYISSCWFLSILVNNFFNCHQLFQL